MVLVLAHDSPRGIGINAPQSARGTDGTNAMATITTLDSVTAAMLLAPLHSSVPVTPPTVPLAYTETQAGSSCWRDSAGRNRLRPMMDIWLALVHSTDSALAWQSLQLEALAHWPHQRRIPHVTLLMDGWCPVPRSVPPFEHWLWVPPMKSRPRHQDHGCRAHPVVCGGV
uniref:Uncharacterized protein n=1 Tax=Anopheles merus TaxID=30066 RepID=A0A182VFI8_ANOME